MISIRKDRIGKILIAGTRAGSILTLMLRLAAVSQSMVSTTMPMPIVIIGMVKNDGTMKEAEERATA